MSASMSHGKWRSMPGLRLWKGRCIRMNSITTWSQGAFIDQSQYTRWTKEEKEAADKQENLLVRPAPTENAICKCNRPEDAKWIASRLNLAAALEQLVYDYATGKSDGYEIVKYVQYQLAKM